MADLQQPQISSSPSTTIYRAGQNNQDILNRIQGGDTNLYNQQLQQAQSDWGSFNQNNDQSGMNAMHSWANQLRDAAGYKGQYDPTTGAMNAQSNTNQTQMYYPSSQQSQSQQQQQQGDPRQQMFMNAWQQYQNMLGGQGIDSQGLMSTANQQAQQQVNMQKAQYEGLINSLNTSKQAEINKINEQTNSASQSLNDKTFQDYLAARAAINSRGGMAGGDMSDANTRLSLGKQQQMGLINQQAADNIAAAQGQFDAQIGATRQQEADLNPSTIANQLYAQLYGNALNQQNSKLQGLAQLLNSTGKFFMPSVDNENDNQTKLADRVLQNQNALDVEDKKGNSALQVAQQQGLNSLATAKQQGINSLDVAKQQGVNSTNVANINTASAERINTAKLANALQINENNIGKDLAISKSTLDEKYNEFKSNLSDKHWNETNTIMDKILQQQITSAKNYMDQINMTADPATKKQMLENYNQNIAPQIATMMQTIQGNAAGSNNNTANNYNADFPTPA